MYAAEEPQSKGKKAHWLQGSLEGKNYRGKQCARSSCEHGRHPDYPGDSQIDSKLWKQHTGSAAKRRAERPPITKSGARVPADVSLPSAATQETNLSKKSMMSAFSVSDPEKIRTMFT
jgi:hypothetical protein